MPKKKTAPKKAASAKKLQPTPGKDHKIKVLAFGDSPAVPSGFATVMRNLFKRLARSGRYDIDIFGINDRGNYKDPEEHPYRIYQARTPEEKDHYGRGRFIDAVRGGSIDLSPPWDIIFMLNDPFVLEEPVPYFELGVIPAIADIQKTHYRHLPEHMWFKTIGYFPIDSPVKPNWAKNAISAVDFPVTYTDYGQDQIQLADDQLEPPTEVKPVIIPHGTDTDKFFALEEEVIARFREEFFAGAVRPDTFIIIAVGRNSARKDLARTMRIFREFHKRRPDSFLYIHAQEQGAWGSLEEAGNQLGLRQGIDWNFPKDFIEAKAFPHQVLNGIYNAADALLSTTQGEGWGLPLTEAMATKTPVLAPNITSIPEILNTKELDDISAIDKVVKSKVRGIPLRSGDTNSAWVNYGADDLERFRPLTNVDDAVKKLLWVYDHPKQVQKITDRAYKWAAQLTWESVVTQWEHLFNQAYKELSRERRQPQKTKKAWTEK